MMAHTIDLDGEFAAITEHWSPRVIAHTNDQFVKLAKVEGEFVWHDHRHEDELFIVYRGQLSIEMEDHTITLGPGQCAVIPKGVRHRPRAEGECWIMLIEPVATRHTGDEVTEVTRSIEDQIGDGERS